MTAVKPHRAVTAAPSSRMTAFVRAHFDAVLPVGTLLKHGHCGGGLDFVAIDGQHVLFDAGCHFPENVPVCRCRRPYAVLCHG